MNEWVKTSERLPIDIDIYLVARGKWVTIATYNRESECWDDADGDDYWHDLDYFEYWMPIPFAP